MEKDNRFSGKVFFKSLVTLFLSYFFLKILYNRLVFGCLDLRRGALLELVVMPVALTCCLWLGARFMKFTICRQPATESRDPA